MVTAHYPLMTENKIIFITLLIALSLWLLPALLLTLRVNRIKTISPSFKRKIIIPMWTVPLVGNLVCYFLFARTGMLNKLSKGEHIHAASTLFRGR